MMKASFASLFFFLLATAPSVAQQQCNACSGADYDPNGKGINGWNCTQWYEEAIKTDIGSRECFMHRFAGAMYCGCPYNEEYGTCDLCPEGALDFYEDKQLPNLQATCGDLAGAIAVDGTITCLGVRHFGEYCGCSSVEHSCSVCSDGQQMKRPNREFLKSNGVTCQWIEDILKLTPSDMCDDVLPQQQMNVESFCGCPGAQAPNVCPFCEEGQVLARPDLIVPGSGDFTCKDFQGYSKHILDDTFCAALQPIADVCCVSETELAAAAAADPVPDAVGFTPEECSFCPNGAAVPDASKTFIGTQTTCGQFQANADAASDESCVSFLSRFADTFDPPTFCGCPNTEPTGVCTLCPEGTVVTDMAKVVSGSDTCADFVTLAGATNDATFCQNVQLIGETYCCEPPEQKRRLGGLREFVATGQEAKKENIDIFSLPVLAAMTFLEN